MGNKCPFRKSKNKYFHFLFFFVGIWLAKYVGPTQFSDVGPTLAKWRCANVVVPTATMATLCQRLPCQRRPCQRWRRCANVVVLSGINWSTQNEIPIVSMVSMLFPWNFSGIIWHPGGMLWNAMEYHGIQKIAIVSMVSMLCYFHGISAEFYGIQVEFCGMPCNSMGYRRLQSINQFLFQNTCIYYTVFTGIHVYI